MWELCRNPVKLPTCCIADPFLYIGPCERPNYEDWSCTAPSIVVRSPYAQVARLDLQRHKCTRIPLLEPVALCDSSPNHLPHQPTGVHRISSGISAKTNSIASPFLTQSSK